MKDLLRIGGVLLLLQALLVAVYLHVSDERADDGRSQTGLGRGPPTPVERAFAPIAIEQRDGTRLSIDPSKPTLVHVWATWCPPCRAELPGLLALDGKNLQVVAVALDPNWQALDKFFDGKIPPQVVRGDADLLKTQLAIQTLPVTLLVGDKRQNTLRFDGARDWASKSFQQRWL